MSMEDKEKDIHNESPPCGFVPYKQWLRQHDEYIKEKYPDTPTADIAGECDLNYYTVSRKAKRLGTGKTKDFMRAHWALGDRRKCKADKTVAWEYLRDNFSDTSNAELAKQLGADVKTIRRWARKLGLEKSKEFMRKSRVSANYRYYTSQQHEWRKRRIAEIYPDADKEGLENLAKELGLGSVHSLQTVAYIYGIKRTPGVLKKGPAGKYGPDFIARFKEYFPNHTNKECAEHFGISAQIIAVLANRHGIRKTAEHISAVRKALASSRTPASAITNLTHKY